MSAGTKRMVTQEIGVERFLRFDGQSAPEYQDHGNVDGRVVREDRVTQRADGSVVHTQYTVFVDGGESYLPTWHDRLTFETRVGLDTDYHSAIVEIHSEGRTLSGVVDHVELLCREE